MDDCSILEQPGKAFFAMATTPSTTANSPISAPLQAVTRQTLAMALEPARSGHFED
jgi:hypothetical protein